jgi:hypothetical protein
VRVLLHLPCIITTTGAGVSPRSDSDYVRRLDSYWIPETARHALIYFNVVAASRWRQRAESGETVMQFRTPASRLPGYRLFWILGFDIRLNLTENEPLAGVITSKNPREFIALKPELESPQD